MLSNFSFHQGASHPDELVLTAKALGYHAVGLADCNTLAGVVRAHTAAKQADLKFLPGVRLDLLSSPSWHWSTGNYDWQTRLPKDLEAEAGLDAGDEPDGLSVIVYPTDREAYGRLCQLMTLGKRRAPKGHCFLTPGDLPALSDGLIALVVMPEAVLLDPELEPHFLNDLKYLKEIFKSGCYLTAAATGTGEDARRLWQINALAEAAGTPMVATNDVRLHSPERKDLMDVLTCIRAHCTLDEAGTRLLANAERHLKSPAEMARIFSDYPEAIARTVEIADACSFSLDELRYEYPADPIPDDQTPQSYLEQLTWEGARRRYKGGIPESVATQIRYEFKIIAELDYAPYFLTVYDIVWFARRRGILCQGRGSAANSTVCYCLGITSVDPTQTKLLFERFVSAARNEPPDIDVDFEHERREEVIQYLYEKYGRDRAGLTATLITYRTRSAVRDVGKTLGLSQDVLTALLSTVWGMSGSPIKDKQVAEAGLDVQDTRLKLALELVEQLKGFPRHLSQHVGGFVLTKRPLSDVVPISNATMADRTVIEWDKDDIDALGILKVDVLGLGMLTCLSKAFYLMARHYGDYKTMATVPQDDPATYDMLCKADSIGVFQVESRAQMTMLPRLKPRKLYDLVIEVAIVRPGPIQGDMVHPYLRRRRGQEPVEYPSEELKGVLERTLGVSLFQEQAMSIAIVGAGFSPMEADQLRRAMAAWRRGGNVGGFKEKFLKGMLNNGYSEEFAERCFKQIEGFGEYGFPESHAFAFAQIAYVSSWLKCHYPAAFACALLNSQPMGFYAPAQIIGDAKKHGVEVRPVDINKSQWDNTLEPLTTSSTGHKRQFAMRLGFRQVKGVSEEDARAIIGARNDPARGIGYQDPHDVWQRLGDTGKVVTDTLELLAKADVFASIGGAPKPQPTARRKPYGRPQGPKPFGRRDALWAVKGLKHKPLPLFRAAPPGEKPANDQTASSDLTLEPRVDLKELKPGEEVVEDYAALRLSLRQHPVSFLRPVLTQDGAVPASRLEKLPHGSKVAVAGLSICRQRPGSAKGTIFITLEDETGVANLVVWPSVFEQFRKPIFRASLLYAEGEVQKDGMVIHVIVKSLRDLTGHLKALTPDDALMEPESVRADRLRHNRRSQGDAPSPEVRVLVQADEVVGGPPPGGEPKPPPHRRV